MHDKRPISRRADHEVDLCGPERMALHRREQLAGGDRHWEWVAHRQWFGIWKAPASSVRIPQMPLRLIFVLNIV
jgi:hypothetical protein